MRKKLFKIIAFLLLWIVIASFVYAFAASTFLFAPSGEVIQASGDLIIITANGNSPKPASVGTIIHPGDTIIVPLHSFSVIRLKNGDEVNLHPGQRLTLLTIFNSSKELDTDMHLLSVLRHTLNLEMETSNVLTLAPG